MLERHRADVLSAQSVGAGLQNLFRGKLDDLACAEAGLSIGCKFGLDSNDLCVRLGQFDRSRDSADQAASTDRYKNELDVRQIFQDFQPSGALSGDDFLIVIWRNDHVPMFRRKLFGFILALSPARTAAYNLS